MAEKVIIKGQIESSRIYSRAENLDSLKKKKVNIFQNFVRDLKSPNTDLDFFVLVF